MGSYPLTAADRRQVFKVDVEQQTQEALELFVLTFPPLARTRLQLSALPLVNLKHEYARLIGAIRMNSQLIKAPVVKDKSATNAEKANEEGNAEGVEDKEEQETPGEIAGKEPEGGGDGGGECGNDDFVSGIGLFRIHSCINHSCSPNAYMTFSVAESRAHAC